MFKKPIGKLLSELVARMGKLKRLKAPGGAELEWFDDKIEDLADQADALPPTTAAESSKAGTTDESVALKLASIDPASAIVAAFVPVEQAAKDYLKSRNIKSVGSPMSGLRRDPTLPDDLKSIVLDMGRVRNIAAHERPDISEETAVAFTQIAVTVSARLRILAAQPAPPSEKKPAAAPRERD